MNDRNKLLSQILIVAEEYDLEIININFTNNVLKDAVILSYKYDHSKFLVIYSYEKDNIYEVNNFASYFRNDLDEKIKGGIIND